MGNILSIDKTKLENACKQLNIEPFDSEEYDFLCEYYEIVNKVAIALKVLEGDKHSFGLYLPTLFGLRAMLDKYADIGTGEARKCVQLAIALKTGFNKRFGKLMNVFDPEGKSIPLFIAMLTNPKYKLNYMGVRLIDPRVLNHLKEILVTAGIETQRTNKSDETSNDDAVANDGMNNGNSKFQRMFFSCFQFNMSGKSTEFFFIN